MELKLIRLSNEKNYRSINAVVGWVKVFLQAEQKRTDFKPETDVDTVATSVRNLFVNNFVYFRISFAIKLPNNFRLVSLSFNSCENLSN